MQQIKMIGLDLDGTLLNTKKELTENTRRVLREAIDAGILVLTLAAAIIMFAKKKGRTFLRTLQAGIGVFFGACGLLVALMLTNFNKYFIQFHLIFFDNDDWILDERVDRLINIVPEGFFSDTAFWIGGVFLGVCLLLFVGAEIILRLWNREHVEEQNGSVEIH